MRGAAEASEARYLFRHVSLNTNDTFIPATQREELLSMLHDLAPRLTAMEENRVNLAYREGRAVIDSMKDTHVMAQEVPAEDAQTSSEKKTPSRRFHVALPPQKAKTLGMWEADCSGTVHVVDLHDMPKTREQTLQLLQTRGDVAMLIAGWFSSHGLCTNDAAQEIIARITSVENIVIVKSFR